MIASMGNMLGQIREYFSKMERKSKIRLGILTVIVIVLAIITVSWLSRVNYVTLHTAQSDAEAGEILQSLRDSGEQARVEGRRILVPENRVQDLRVLLASQGVIGPSGIDLTILESAAGFNISSDHAKQLYDYQIASALTTQLLTYEMIQNAVVTVRSGETSSFAVSQGTREATAAVVLVVRGGAVLSNQQAQAIGELIKGNVPGIKPENISISDNRLNYYPIGDGSVDLGTEIHSRIALRNLLQQQLKVQGEQLLTPIFGMSNLQISASVSLNFDRRVTESVEFFPPIPGEMDGIVRSSSEIYENSRRSDIAEGIPGTDPNAMGTVEYPYGTLADGYEYARAVLDRNYDINETREIIEHEQGTIESVEIAILIDRETITEDFTAEVTNLVSRGLGIAPGNIAVEHVPFSYRLPSFEELQAEIDAERARLEQRELIETILMWAVILLLGIAFISLIKTIVRAIRGPEPEPLLADGYDGYDEGGYIDYVADDEISMDDEYDEVQLTTKSSGLEQIERFIDKDPDAVAQLLRNWLTDD